MAMIRNQSVNKRYQSFYKVLLFTLSLCFLIKDTTGSMKMGYSLCPPMDIAAIRNGCETHEPNHCGGKIYCLRGIGEECYEGDVRYSCKRGLTCKCNRCQNCDKNKCFLEMCADSKSSPYKRFMRQRSYLYNTYDDAY